MVDVNRIQDTNYSSKLSLEIQLETVTEFAASRWQGGLEPTVELLIWDEA